MSISRLNNVAEIRKAESGFTLIELSIVLVIIGLIVGGVLVGQDLIKAAEQRATIAQIEKYNTAVNTFRNKYGGIPGDLAEATASSFGLAILSGAATVGGAGEGDGNGLVEGGAAQTTKTVGEEILFFRHLSDASLVDGAFAPTANANGSIATALDGTLGAATSGSGMSTLYPQAKLARGNFIIPISNSGINYFVVAGLNGASITVAGVVSSGTNNMTPPEAYNIDKKVDDGNPGSGAVQAFDNSAANALSTYATFTSPMTPLAAAAGTASCVVTGNASYNLQITGQYCALRMRFN